jgi:KUP system potassium uptake protein
MADKKGVLTDGPTPSVRGRGAAAQGAHAHDGGHSHGGLAALSLGALGVVYGDIGTSPLYAFKECLGGEHGVSPSPANVLGLLSLIFWSLMMVVTVKYLTFIMRADNKGEGGILALLALIPEKLRAPAGAHVGWLAVLVIAGAALLYGDGMITPSISVLSAMEGVEVASAEPIVFHVFHHTVPLKSCIVPATCVILVGLFAIQSRGTGTVGKLFGPVMLLWFGTLAALGAWHLSKNLGVLVALDPRHAFAFFRDHGFHGFVVLGSVVLVVTGGEALYADMGHFGRGPIRVAWLGVVLPSLVLAYFGMGALVLADPAAAANPFFAMVPKGPPTIALVVLSTLATIIASQALISGAFSLTNQAIQLGFFPRVTVKHTSSEAEGQIYVPEINWFLAAACILLVVSFRESSKLAAAYGIAVTGTMGITSVIYFVVVRRSWGWSVGKAAPLLVLFLVFDLGFFGSNVLKFFDGGYVPIAVAAVFLVLMLVWKIGRGHLADFVRSKSPPLDEFLTSLPEPDAPVREPRRGEVIRVPGTGVFMASSSAGTPPVLAHHVERLGVVPKSVVLLTISFEHVPFVDASTRVRVEALGKGFVRVVGRYGFMESADVPQLLAQAASDEAFSPDLDDVTYFLGRETFVATKKGKMGPWSEGLFSLLSRNSRSATAYFSIPPEQVMEIGSQIDL